MSASSSGKSDVGVNIALAGLVFQVFTLCLFIVAAVDYAILSRSIWATKRLPRKFIVFCAFMSLGTLLVLMRCCYVSERDLHSEYLADSH